MSAVWEYNLFVASMLSHFLKGESGCAVGFKEPALFVCWMSLLGASEPNIIRGLCEGVVGGRLYAAKE